jgi:hypothetical protein
MLCEDPEKHPHRKFHRLMHWLYSLKYAKDSVQWIFWGGTHTDDYTKGHSKAGDI